MEVINNNSENECNGSLNSDQKDTAIFVFSSLGLVSFISCLLIIILLFYLKLHKRFIYRLAMYQAISSMMISVSDMSVISASSYVQNYNETIYNDICQVTGFFMNYIYWVKLLFTSSLVVHLFLMAVCLKEFQKLEIVHVLVSTLFPLLLCWIPFVGHHYGPAGAWCWITAYKHHTDCTYDNDGFIEQLALWYVPCNISLVLCIVATVIASIVLIWRGIKRRQYSTNEETQPLQTTHRQSKKALLEVVPLLAYPAIFLLFMFFATINLIYSTISSRPHFSMWIIHSVTTGMLGTCSSIALLIHITVTRYLNKRHNTLVSRSTNFQTSYNSKNRQGIFSSYGETVSSYRNYYIFPRESEIDRLIEYQ